MMKYRLPPILWFTMLFAGCAFAPPKVEISQWDATQTKQAKLESLERDLEKAVAKGAPPGLTLAVIKGQETRYQKSFGWADGPRRQPMVAQSVFQWWSITKLFTVTAILQLQEQGKLELDDPVVKHLPFLRFRGKVSNDSTITLRHLLSHSSGLGDIGMSILGWVHYDGDSSLNQTDLLKSKWKKYNKVAIEPGREGRYSNFGFLILAAVIESVSGGTYEDYIRSHILTPLKMTHTDFVYTPALREFEAAGSHPRDFISHLVPMYIDMKRAVREKVDGTFWFNRVYSDQKGATGLIGSAEDLMVFVKALMGEGDAGTVRILSPKSLALMREPVVKVASSPAPNSTPLEFGLGWFIHREKDKLTLSHGGSGMGFVAMLQISLPQKVAVIALANSTYLGRTMGLDVVERLATLDW